jgi:hypothetical protein
MDRIEINGVWYVREDSIAEEEIKDLDITEFDGCLYESDKYCWEATRMKGYDNEYFDDIDIKFTDKRIKPWIEENWDNNFWMRGVLLDKKDDMLEADKSMCKKGVADFKQFLQILKEKGWFQ